MHKSEARQARYCELETSKGKVLLPYELRRYKRMRSIKVTVSSADRVMLKVPWCMSEGSAVAFLKQQGDWVVEAIGQMPKVPELYSYLEQSPYVSADGRKIYVEIESSANRSSWIYSESERLLVIRLKCDENRNLALRDILKAFAREVIAQRTKTLASLCSVEFRRISVRDQRSLWGSCTDCGSLSFNWRLILLPPLLMDHVIYHELAHLTHMNHSNDFYNLLGQYDSNAEYHDEALDVISAEIMPLARC
jgi:hypothetical protein